MGPDSQRQLIANALWSRLKDKIFDTEKDILRGLHRHIQLTMIPTNDYLAKLELIDSHPEMFDKKKRATLSKADIEGIINSVSRSKRLKFNDYLSIQGLKDDHKMTQRKKNINKILSNQKSIRRKVNKVEEQES